MGHGQRTNPMGILFTKEQSYGDMMHVTKNLMHVQTEDPILWDSACSYM